MLQKKMCEVANQGVNHSDVNEADNFFFLPGIRGKDDTRSAQNK